MKTTTVWGSVSLAILVIAITMFVNYEQTVSRKIDDHIVEVLDSIRYVPNIQYGINLDQVSFCKDVIKQNEFLSDILTDLNIPYVTIDRLSKETKDIFDVRYLRAGQTYCAIFDTNGIETKCKFFIYEENKVDYIVYEFTEDSVIANRHSKPIQVREREATGVIASSLYETLLGEGIDPYLAIEMSEVYAWTIDFYRLQKGDRFKIKFTELYVEDELIGVDKISSCMFTHMNKDLYAFYYEKDSIRMGDYYDETGMSMRKAFLKSPVKYSRISSRFTMRRFHPVQKRYKAHLGTDYAAPYGTPIYSTADGVVEKAEYGRYNGNYVKVRHNGTYSTQYLHMKKIEKGVRPGVFVKQGEIIGYVGSTGLATGPHVCYRFWKNNQQVDPYKQKLPDAEPIEEEHKEMFMKGMQRAKEALDLMEFPPEEIEEKTETEEQEVAVL